MKTRIIAMLLLVVMLVSVLASCGYSYMKEDYDKYVTFDKEKLDALLANIEIHDGDFTADELTRNNKVIDTIYATLAGKVDKEDKITEGKAGAHDILYYCYYATVENDAKEPVVILASKMQESSATKLQLGVSDAEGIDAEIGKKMAEYQFTADEKVNAYKTLTTGKAESGKIAYITYTVEYKETVDGTEKTKTATYTYEKVTIGDENHPFAAKLAGYDIGSVFKDSANENKTTVTVDGKTYSNIKINWVVESGEGFSFTHKTYTATTSEKAVDGTAMELKDKELTYHVFPVYYLSVAEFSAKSLIKLVFSSITEDTLPSFEGKEAAIKTLNELKTAYSDAQSKTAEAEKNVETAQTALDKANDAVDESVGATEAQKITIEAAEKSLKDNQKALADAEDAEKTAEEALDAGIDKFYETVKKDTIETEYKNDVYDTLLDEYNNEIKNNLAKAIWTAMQEYSEVAIPSNKAIKPVYDRLMENHRYDFSTGTYNSTTKVSNYKQFKGNFDNYLKYATGVGDADVIVAKDKVWAEAEAYVQEIFVVFAVAKAYDLLLTEKDMKEFREDENSSYSYYEYTYGDANVQVAVQFDKFMDYILEWNTEGKDEDEKVVYVGDKIDFVRVNYTIETEHDH